MRGVQRKRWAFPLRGDGYSHTEHLSLGVSCHSVKDAAAAVNAEIGDFVKNICMVSPTGQFIVAIVKGEDNASTSRVGKA